MGAGRGPGAIRSKLLRIVIAALLPTVLLGAWQASLTFDDSRALVANRLRANAWGIAESERDPFIIARHALSMVSRQDDVRQITARCNAALAAAQQGASGIVNFLRTDRAGRARCSVLPFVPGQDVSRGDWWQKAREGRRLVLGEPRIGEVSHQPVLVLAQPMLSDTGTFDGTVSAAIGLDGLRASLETKQRKLPGAVLVTDGGGKPILSTGPARFSAIGDPRGAQTAPRMIEAADGQVWLYVSAPLFGQDLHVIYAEPRRAVTAMALSRMWLILLLPLAAMVIAFLAIWYGTQRMILRWLPQLHRLTERFARGDFACEQAAYARAPIEIAELAAGLHTMAGALAAHDQAMHEALAIKTALTREVHHRVKNNLQIVVSLLTLQADRARDEWAREVLGQARSRIAALGLIHRLLYESEGAGEQGVVRIQRLIAELCAQLRAAHRHRREIDLACHGADIELSVDRAVPVTLFAVEAITNAFRHAFEPGAPGRITANFSVADGEGRMVVADNGRGFIAAKSQSQMGITLIHAFAEQLGGRIGIDSSGQGATLTLTFPLEPAGQD